MTESTPKRLVRRGRIFPEITISPEELAKRKAEKDAFHQRCRAIFERLRPQFIDKHYGWYIAVEPDSGDYFIDADNIWSLDYQEERWLTPESMYCWYKIFVRAVCG
jgi:hypothetical protein